MPELRIPGAVYNECFDPYCTDVPREEGWPKSTTHRVGKGFQHRYIVTPEQREDMLQHAEDFGEAISYGVDDPTAGRMIVRWVERERAK